MTFLIFLIFFLFIILVIGFVHMDGADKPLYLLPTDDKKWKRVVELYYQDNILTVRTFDNNIREFYHTINNTEWPTVSWRRHPSYTIVKDKELIDSLNKCYRIVLEGEIIPISRGGGWAKTLPSFT